MLRGIPAMISSFQRGSKPNPIDTKHVVWHLLVPNGATCAQTPHVRTHPARAHENALAYRVFVTHAWGPSPMFNLPEG